jgi:4-diphosphocytidyl-2-C-methyl-D-erythritol kinase
MIQFPNAKINLGLQITGKRADGYHNLATIFYPLPLTDILEITATDTPQFTATGLPVPGASDDNLCLKAYHLLKTDFSLPPVRIHLHKNIPMGAGLGGGSSDGAFTLRLLNDTFQLGLSNEQLIGYALQLGSDCPFFIYNQSCFATGRGEALEPITLNLDAYRFAVVHPGLHVSTAWAFAQINAHALPGRDALKEIIQLPVSEWKNKLVNDFEKPVMQAHPVIAAIKNTLYEAGALYASMSGSGSAVFGIFEKETPLQLDDAYRLVWC